MPTTRRDLLKTAAAGALGFGLAPRAFAQATPPEHAPAPAEARRARCLTASSAPPSRCAS